MAAVSEFQVEVFWVVMPCNIVVGYQSFRYPCCRHLQGEVLHHCTTPPLPTSSWRWRQHGPL